MEATQHWCRCRCGESASAFHTTNPLTNTQQGLLAALHPRCLACSPRSLLPNEFMIILFSREMKHGDIEVKKCVAPGNPDKRRFNCNWIFFLFTTSRKQCVLLDCLQSWQDRRPVTVAKAALGLWIPGWWVQVSLKGLRKQTTAA